MAVRICGHIKQLFTRKIINFLFVLGSFHQSNIGSNLFKDLSSLKKLDLNNNTLTNIHPDAFEGLHNLENLELNSNQLTRIQSNGFKTLKSLEFIEHGYCLEFRARKL